VTVFGALIVVVAILFYLPLTLLAPIASITPARVPYVAPVTTAPVFSMPGYGASAIAQVGRPGLLARGGTTRPMPIASITKVFTSLIVLSKRPLTVAAPGPSIAFTAQDVAIRAEYLARNGEVGPVRVGASISEKDVLTIALVASDNNYARALADWAFGSEKQFVVAAKAWLAAHGFRSTTLTDATGLNPENRSTPTDLIALGRLALANPVVKSIVSIRHTTMPVVGPIDNTNTILGDLGIDGIKTGTLDSAGSSLLFATELTVLGKQVRLIGVILDGPDHPTIDRRIKSMIQTVRAGFTTITLVAKGQPFASYSTPWGSAAKAVAAHAATAVVWKGSRVTATESIAETGPAKRGTPLGSVRFRVDGAVETVPLELGSTLQGPPFWWRLTNPLILR
jgi:D-alanyl-D-alanine carboxypeptidase (penicillin-binding protein 5/6)